MNADAVNKCECTPLDGGGYQCVCKCGMRLESRVRHVFHICEQTKAADGSHPTVAAQSPTLLQKAANFATSAAKHVAAGMPRCTQEQVDARFAICQTCEHYDGKACRLCGCPVVREQAFVSKLSWANEKCPAGKWGPVNQDSQP